MPRETIFTQKLADRICEELVSGRSLRSICQDEGIPAASTIIRWLANGELEGASEEFRTFRKQYARAREAQAESLADEILDIADDGSNDWMHRNGKDGEDGWQFNGEAARRSQIRIDSRKWLAGKLAPKRYGDKVVTEHVGKDGGEIKIATNEDRARALMAFLAKTGGGV